MSCLHPKPAILIDNPLTGKKKVRFLRWDTERSYAELKEKYGDLYVDIPCGSCLACVEQRVRSWAIRCTLEASEYENNCFLSLTYNPASLPSKGLSKKDLFKFIKRLRNYYGAGIRYYGCGEYGSYGRAHYHMILFNFWPKDAELVSACAFGGFYYRSRELNKLWPFGFVSIGEVSYNSCAYVARYCQKKLKHELGVVGCTPEFSFMSRRPGIGENYFKKHFDSLVATDKIYAHINDNFTFSSFRYFDKLIEKIDPVKIQELKDKRISNATLSVGAELLARNLSSMEQYLMFQERVMNEKYNRLKRRLE